MIVVKKLILCCGVIALAEPAYSQVELKTYADSDGYLDAAVGGVTVRLK
jgi:hypothetical protein